MLCCGRDGLINVVIVTKDGPILKNVIDCTPQILSEGVKDMAYIAGLITTAINEIGTDNVRYLHSSTLHCLLTCVSLLQVVQVLTDGGNRGVWELVAANFPTIVVGWCATHVLDLLLENIGKMKWFQQVFAFDKSIGCDLSNDRATSECIKHSQSLKGDSEWGEVRVCWHANCTLAVRLLR